MITLEFITWNVRAGKLVFNRSFETVAAAIFAIDYYASHNVKSSYRML